MGGGGGPPVLTTMGSTFPGGPEQEGDSDQGADRKKVIEENESY